MVIPWINLTSVRNRRQQLPIPQRQTRQKLEDGSADFQDRRDAPSYKAPGKGRKVRTRLHLRWG